MFSQNIECKISGLNTLNKKETNRIKSVDTELQNLITNKKIKTYNDHRMALAFAPLSILKSLEINEPSVVSKSFPEFWKKLKDVGFSVDFYN